MSTQGDIVAIFLGLTAIGLIFFVCMMVEFDSVKQEIRRLTEKLDEEKP